MADIDCVTCDSLRAKVTYVNRWLRRFLPHINGIIEGTHWPLLSATSGTAPERTVWSRILSLAEVRSNSNSILCRRCLRVSVSGVTVVTRDGNSGCQPYFSWNNWRPFLPIAVIFSERELKFTFAICRRPSVCRLSVCNVRAPYSDDWNFRQCFYAIGYLGHLLTSR